MDQKAKYMTYAEVFIKGAHGCFTWHTDQEVDLGSRVKINFRGKPKIGIVVSLGNEKPDFKTQPVLEVLDLNFVPPSYIDLSRTISERHFSSLNKALSLVVPSKFLEKERPVKPEKYIKKVQNFETLVAVKGKLQKALLDSLSTKNWINEKELKANFSTQTINSLLKKSLIEVTENLTLEVEKIEGKKVELNPEQQVAFDTASKADKPTLIWGVTGSGKTEVYKALAQQNLSPTGQMLLLVPEIGLTPQLINHFKSLFGDSVAVWHSNLSEGEKTKTWLKLVLGETKILIGARSAVFVPLPNLELIVIDEEHEWTYKNEFAPRFWVHEVAEILMKTYGANLVLGSATPRVESFYKTKNNEWNLAELKQKFFKSPRPKIQLIDLKNEAKRGNYSPISEPLAQEIKKMLSAKRQSVIFLNKRGYAGATMCRFCGHTFECDNCSSNMKVHGVRQEKLVCHICHALKFFPKDCPECSNSDFKFKGWGTQQVEEVLKKKFPEARILRADTDSVSGKYDFDRLIEKFHKHEADILLGTQMIAKGLDFAKVDLVGLILADVGLNLPDFRSEERTFQILNQVAGRTGRRETPGKVLVQTYEPDHEVFGYLVRDDVQGFIDNELATRAQMKFSPFAAVIKFTFADVSKNEAFAQAKNFYSKILEEVEDEDEVFWAPAFFPRIHNKYWFHVFVKTQDRPRILELLKKINISKARVDIDPASLL